MAIYRHQNLRALSDISLAERMNNQVELLGTNEKLFLTKGIFFLELLVIEAGKTVTIKDGAGRTIATGLTGFEQDYSPLRCDYGIEFVGDVELAKGFVLEEVFA